jgi:choline dehydrogenase-like flavoprotein
MIFDLNALPAGEARRGYHACIIGAGVAGITLALDLAARGRRVLLLEAGGLEFTEASQNIYKGKNVGRPYFDLDVARLRFLGGTSNHWEGVCRPLDAWDFESRPYIPNSGWPITKADVAPFLVPASQILEIDPKFNDSVVEGSANTLRQVDFHLSPPVRFGEKYLQALKDSKEIDAFVNANVVDMRLSETKDRMVECHCANYANQSLRYIFAADTFVLAMGGIENPRTMLNCRSQIPTGIGNAQDLVGRYFMDHLDLECGYYVAEKETWPYDDTNIFMSPTPEFMAQEKIGNGRLELEPANAEGSATSRWVKKHIVCADDMITDFVKRFYDVSCPKDFFDGGYLKVESEQVPNPDSRVFLSDDTDRFGLRRVALDWRIADIDRRTIKSLVVAVGSYLAAKKYGNVRLADWLLDDSRPMPSVANGEKWGGAAYHHMGTTRMGRTPTEGVVDENCRVFGVDNLFVAGSSVFSTGGQSNPTLTIVQLTLRLGEHLDQMLKS